MGRKKLSQEEFINRCIEKHPEYESLDQDERIKAHNLIMANKTEEAQEYRVQNAIKFLNEYPKFRPIVNIEA